MPRPRAGEVLVSVAACGVCHTDLHVVKARGPLPDAVRAGPRGLGHGRGARDRASRRDAGRLAIGQRVVGAFIMPCGTCYYCVRGQDGLCETFFTLNRLGGKLYDGDTRLRRPTARRSDVLDGRPRRVRGRSRSPAWSPLPGRPAVRRLGDPRLRGLHGVRRGPTRRGPPRRRVGRGGGDRRRRLERHSDGAGVRRPRSSPLTFATTSWRRRAVLARPTRSTADEDVVARSPRADRRSGRGRGVRGARPAATFAQAPNAARAAGGGGRDRAGR